MVRTVRDFLRSLKWLPNQSALDQVLRHTMRIVVIEKGKQDGTPLGRTVLLDTSDPADIATFHDCLDITQTDYELLEVLCPGDYTLKLYADQGLLASIELYRHAIRWKRWKGDAHLKDGQRLRDWLVAHGVQEPFKQPGC